MLDSMKERDTASKVFYIVLGPIFPMYLRSIGEDTLGAESNRDMAMKLGPLNASCLVLSCQSEGDMKTFHIIAKYKESIMKSEIRGRISSLFPPSVPVPKILGLEGWDLILRRMLAFGPLVVSLVYVPDKVIIFEVKNKRWFDRIKRSFTSFRRVCPRCGHRCSFLRKKRPGKR